MRLRVASLNVWALPWGLSRDVGPRLAAIAAALPRLAADVVSFQEVWTVAALRSLVAGGRRAGLVHAGFEGEGDPRGGLLVLSRAPIRRARFETYALRGLPERVWNGDYFADKGFLDLRLETAAGPVAVVDTHLVARYSRTTEGDAYFHHRAGQAIQLATHLAEIRDPLIAAGDFNVREGDPEYRVLLGLAGLRDAAVETGHRQATALASNPYRGRNLDSRIDYVFARSGPHRSARPISVTRVLDDPLEIDGHPGAHSDHAGLVAEVELRTQDAAGPPVPEPSALSLASALLESGRAAAELRQRDQRVPAGAGLAGALLAGVLGHRTALTRRRLLRRALQTGALAALAASLGLATLSEVAAPAEFAAYAHLRHRLARSRPSRGRVREIDSSSHPM